MAAPGRPLPRAWSLAARLVHGGHAYHEIAVPAFHRDRPALSWESGWIPLPRVASAVSTPAQFLQMQGALQLAEKLSVTGFTCLTPVPILHSSNTPLEIIHRGERAGARIRQPGCPAPPAGRRTAAAARARGFPR